MESPGLLFVVGFPRSGTTWLRELFAEHPSVAARNAESYVFDDRYLGGCEATWKAELAHAAGGHQPFALSAILSQAEFDELMRAFAASVLRKIADARPGARLVVEKTPTHAYHSDLILRLFPQAQFLHIVRDPREVYCSTRAAARGWGNFWASEDAVDVSRRWNMFVERALTIEQQTPRYRKVRYEDLHADTPATLAGIFEWLGLAHDAALCARISEACSLDALRQRWSHNPAFFRRGAASGWRQELRPSEVALIEHITRRQLQTQGYALVTSGAKPFGLRLRDVVARVASAGARRLQGLADGPFGAGRRKRT